MANSASHHFQEIYIFFLVTCLKMNKALRVKAEVGSRGVLLTATGTFGLESTVRPARCAELYDFICVLEWTIKS